MKTETEIIQNEIKQCAIKMIGDGVVDCVLAWRRGDFIEFTEPGFFTDLTDIENIIFNRFCSANLSKFAVEAVKQYRKTLIFLKPCDSYSFNQLIKENLIIRDRVHIIGIGC
ncbi:MAG: 4Fe-4S ferredoxin, partial [Defluviitaleaceae bacterium]|nr:4Fe-4S ferredoxin [Defluviitaleaceae bacterium]